MELQADMTQLAPSEAWRGRSPTRSFRMNLTYRHAPELCGHENEERFYHFGECLGEGGGFVKS